MNFQLSHTTSPRSLLARDASRQSRCLAHLQLDELQPTIDHAEGELEDRKRPAAQRSKRACGALAM
jgi:hypothetical protein